MKIILYLLLIAFIALTIYSVYKGITNADWSSVTSKISSAFTNAVLWVQDKTANISSTVSE